ETASSAMPDGLDYFGARYFSGAQGRFTSPDAPLIGQHPENPQSWNLYSYGLNNPLRYVDPTGHDPDPADAESCRNDEHCLGAVQNGKFTQRAQLLPPGGNGAVDQAVDKVAGTAKELANGPIGLLNLLGANIPAFQASNTTQQQAMTETSLAGALPGPGMVLLPETGLVNLASESQTIHILQGDATGGGHMWPGLPGKTVFPQDWSAGQIMHQISDIATDPGLKWVQQTGQAGSMFTRAGDPARFFVIGNRGGIPIKVILEPAGRGIITGFPVK
ncbi:MAG TPA: RHS repeat-associated core domain-containing protein, partial [Candidatus Saccharimonadales bacterium]|nr:RHS repeat-associated core domain-containing protein [Candidatus Saccharimonadales bacterium]